MCPRVWAAILWLLSSDTQSDMVKGSGTRRRKRSPLLACSLVAGRIAWNAHPPSAHEFIHAYTHTYRSFAEDQMSRESRVRKGRYTRMQRSWAAAAEQCLSDPTVSDPMVSLGLWSKGESPTRVDLSASVRASSQPTPALLRDPTCTPISQHKRTTDFDNANLY